MPRFERAELLCLKADEIVLDQQQCLWWNIGGEKTFLSCHIDHAEKTYIDRTDREKPKFIPLPENNCGNCGDCNCEGTF